MARNRVTAITIHSLVPSDGVRIRNGLMLVGQGDVRAEQDLKDNDPRSTRRTKLICTIGPASCSSEMLATLAANGMNVARLNMCHGDQEWHRQTIAKIRKINSEKG